MLTHFGGSVRMFRESVSGASLQVNQIAEMAQKCPTGKLIIGHVGLWQNEDVLRVISPLENVFVDTSFQSHRFLRKVVNQIGEERVLFGSDFPLGNPVIALKELLKTGLKNHTLERILSGNALELLNLGRVYQRLPSNGLGENNE
jgi:hypothetical protein